MCGSPDTSRNPASGPLLASRCRRHGALREAGAESDRPTRDRAARPMSQPSPIHPFSVNGLGGALMVQSLTSSRAGAAKGNAIVSKSTEITIVNNKIKKFEEKSIIPKYEWKLYIVILCIIAAFVGAGYQERSHRISHIAPQLEQRPAPN